jgi:hypothetical protein
LHFFEVWLIFSGVHRDGKIRKATGLPPIRPVRP